MINMATHLLLLVDLVGACQTTNNYLNPQLPAGLSDYFHSCSQGDGSVHMRLRKESEYLGDVNLEWFAADKKPFVYQVYEPLGRTVLSLQYDKGRKHVVVSGSWSSALPPLSVDEDGFILMDKKRIGLKYEEVPCLLRFKFPAIWLTKVTRSFADHEGVKLDIRENLRTAKLILKPSNLNKSLTACAHIEWNAYWGFVTSRYDLCYDYGSRNKAVLTGLNGYSLEWTDDE